jgi:hypothetical protein
MVKHKTGTMLETLEPVDSTAFEAATEENWAGRLEQDPPDKRSQVRGSWKRVSGKSCCKAESASDDQSHQKCETPKSEKRSTEIPAVEHRNQ